jgi:hypothetical protein
MRALCALRGHMSRSSEHAPHRPRSAAVHRGPSAVTRNPSILPPLTFERLAFQGALGASVAASAAPRRRHPGTTRTLAAYSRMERCQASVLNTFRAWMQFSWNQSPAARRNSKLVCLTLFPSLDAVLLEPVASGTQKLPGIATWAILDRHEAQPTQFRMR